MVKAEDIRVIGRSPFHDIQLTCSGDLSYLGSQWRRDIGCVGNNVSLQGDIGAGQMIFGVPDVDPLRREELIQLLDIDLDWRMNTVSDGQRRRVQICLGLLKPYQVLLLDEVTVDMDVVGRLELLDFFKKESEERGATIVYATHIFDGLEPWVTHLAYVAGGKLQKGGIFAEVMAPELESCGHGGRHKKLLQVVESWLQAEKDQRGDLPDDPNAEEQREAPILPSKHLMYFR